MNKLILILITGLFLLACTQRKENMMVSISKIDTVAIQSLKTCPPCEEDIEKPIPERTRFKVSDWVCGWERWSGVVVDIEWSENHPDVLIYEVQYYNANEEWVNLWHYDTELTSGKCD